MVELRPHAVLGFNVQFQATYDLLEELKNINVAHLAEYSTRPGTVANRNMQDDVPERKGTPLARIQHQHERISDVINRRYRSQTVEVLVEDKHKGVGAAAPAPTLVFFEDESGDERGQLARVKIKDRAVEHEWTIAINNFDDR